MSEEKVIGRCGAESRLLELEMRSVIDKIRLGVLDAGNLTIPLWGPQRTLTWEFNDHYIDDYFERLDLIRDFFRNPREAKEYLRQLIHDSLKLWGRFLPIEIREDTGITDFNVVLYHREDCRIEDNVKKCVLASAFFPNYNEKRLILHPTMFNFSMERQKVILAHEFGHVLGLRHYFAHQKEADWPSVLYGHDNPISIMNYGEEMVFTETDGDDLMRLYYAVWRGEITHVGGIPIKLY